MTIVHALAFFAAVIPSIWNHDLPDRVDPFRPPAVSAPILVQTPEPDPGMTPAPGPDPTPTPAPTSQPGIIPQIFKVIFSAETLSEALAEALESAAEQEADSIDSQTAEVSALIVEILKAPESGRFAGIAASTFATAAALAPALFIIRLVLYHWNRLLDEDDGVLRVFGDWLAAGFLAVSAGPFLDLVVQTGWWLAGSALGATEELAVQFIAVTSVTETIRNLTTEGRASMLAALFWILGGLGGLVGVVGLAAAFAVAQAVLFVLAVVAPVVAVMAVIPQMRWMRGLWLKAVAVLALLPVAAGGIFKAGVILSVYFGGGGFPELFIRLFWLWGAVGFLLSLAGILGKVTLSSAVEATMKLGKGAREIISTAALALGGAPAPAAAAAAGSASKNAGNAAAHASGPAGAGSSDGLQPPQYIRSKPAQEVLPTSNLRPAGSGTGPSTPAGLVQPEPYFAAAGLELDEVRRDLPGEVDTIGHVPADRADEVSAYPDPLAEALRPAGADRIAEQPEDQGSGAGS